jgi:Rad3-related DNA helicase
MVLESFAVRFPEVPVDVQESEMRLEDRDEFLQRFSAESEDMRVGFAVLGGIFGEGIDLVGDRLSGAAIVGVGLPAICLERELIRSHASALGDPGFDKAYRYPGMNRVLQAVGRVIRSEKDRGAVLLVGSRFSYPGYRNLLPPEWRISRIRSNRQLSSTLEEFWRGQRMEGSS